MNKFQSNALQDLHIFIDKKNQLKSTSFLSCQNLDVNDKLTCTYSLIWYSTGIPIYYPSLYKNKQIFLLTIYFWLYTYSEQKKRGHRISNYNINPTESSIHSEFAAFSGPGAIDIFWDPLGPF